MRTRRDIKKAWFVMQLMLASNGLHDNEMKAINKTKFKFEKKLNEIDTIKESLEIINTRRALLHSNPELELIFRMFWILMQPYKDPITNIINEEGYIKFNIYIQYAVIGKKMNQNDALNVAKTDYLNDIASYGPLGQECFYDILLELIEMWSENTIIKFTIAFTWELLNSICDIRSYPPRFRSLKHVPCISLIDESVSIIQLFKC